MAPSGLQHFRNLFKRDEQLEEEIQHPQEQLKQREKEHTDVKSELNAIAKKLEEPAPPPQKAQSIVDHRPTPPSSLPTLQENHHANSSLLKRSASPDVIAVKPRQNSASSRVRATALVPYTGPRKDSITPNDAADSGFKDYICEEYKCIVNLGGVWALVWCPVCGVNCNSEGGFLNGMSGIQRHIDHMHRHLRRDEGKMLDRKEIESMGGYRILSPESVAKILNFKLMLGRKKAPSGQASEKLPANIEQPAEIPLDTIIRGTELTAGMTGTYARVGDAANIGTSCRSAMRLSTSSHATKRTVEDAQLNDEEEEDVPRSRIRGGRPRHGISSEREVEESPAPFEFEIDEEASGENFRW